MQVFDRLRSRYTVFRVKRSSSDQRFHSLVDTLQKEKFDFRQFEETIGYRPRDWRAFFEALLHRSYLQFLDPKWVSNERLEFLGDAILDFVVAEHLFILYPEMEEGSLTKVRSRLVNRRILATRSKELRLFDYLLLSASAAQSVEGGADSILADAYEAIVGAMYVDGGLDPARGFIHRTILLKPDIIAMALTDDNYKSALLEYSQGIGFGVPRYTVQREDGPEHDRRFTVDVSVGSQPLGTGSGRSKKEAEQAAAAQAIERLQTHPITIPPEPPHDESV
jgi:ribonuclease-3